MPQLLTYGSPAIFPLALRLVHPVLILAMCVQRGRLASALCPVQTRCTSPEIRSMDLSPKSLQFRTPLTTQPMGVVVRTSALSGPAIVHLPVWQPDFCDASLFSRATSKCATGWVESDCWVSRQLMSQFSTLGPPGPDCPLSNLSRASWDRPTGWRQAWCGAPGRVEYIRLRSGRPTREWLPHSFGGALLLNCSRTSGTMFCVVKLLPGGYAVVPRGVCQPLRCA